MCGSLNVSETCYIKYLLRVRLNHPVKEKNDQLFDVILNIIEPLRSPVTPTTTTQITQSKCCSCCMDYGQASITLNCDRNFCFNGDKISVNGAIDNSKGKKKIGFAVVFL